MPTRLLLEGSDLAELMGQVRAEFGPAARIVRAERVRSGGLAGFFARERYELTIDVPDPAPTPVPSLRARRAALAARGGAPALSGMDALLAAADAADGAPALESVPEQPGPEDAPRVSTGEAAFADLLEQMRALSGLPPEDRVVEVPADSPAWAADADPAGSRAATLDPASAESGADVIDSATAGSRIDTLDPVPGGSRTDVVDPVPAADAPDVIDRALAGAAWDAVPGTGDPRARVFEPTTAPTLPVGTVGTGAAVGPEFGHDRAPASGPVTRAHLADLGVPAPLLALVGDGPVQLSRLLSAVPSAPVLPRDPGAVLAVVGLPEDALRVAELLVMRHTSSGAVVRAGDLDAPAARRLTTPAAATRWRQQLDPHAELTVVAVGVAPGRSRESAAADLIAALAPTQLWAVADARSKPRDCTRWLGGVGAVRAVDALAVTGLFDTSEPGTVLGLPVPVAWIDGVPASRMAWAAALGEHLPPGTDWT